MASTKESEHSASIEEPWLLGIEEVAQAVGTDIQQGLRTAEAAVRLGQSGPNRLDANSSVPSWRKFIEQFRDPLIYLLLVAVAVSLVAWIMQGAEGVPFEVIVISIIILANGMLGYLQEARAEQAVAALQRMAAATATVVREGVTHPIPATDIVPGDVLLLAEGDAVPADARLIEAASLKVAEASLTGESEAVLKDSARLQGEVSLGDRLNMVFSGTGIASGRARAVVTATGMHTEMGSIARLLGRTENEITPLQREVGFIGRILGVVVVVITLVVVGSILLTSDIEGGSDLVDVLLVGVSLAVAAVPEGLPAVLSVVLALGVQRMARQRAIVKKLSSVETLGSASVICSDKTGTLTRNEMTVTTVVTASGRITVTGTGYRPEGEFLVEGQPLVTDGGGALLEELRSVLAGGSLANDAVLREVDGEWVVQGDPTEAAFLVAESKLGITRERETRFQRVAEVPFTSERKIMSALEADAERDGQVVVVTKGAPDVLLDRCVAERVAGEVVKLTSPRREEILDTVERLADEALRPLAVAYRRLTQSEAVAAAGSGMAVASLEELEQALIYLGMVGIVDPPRQEAVAAIQDAHNAGIRVMMITGDHPRTAIRIANELGLAPSGARALVGYELEAMSEAELQAAVGEVSVYARVSPQHKLRIVDALQAEGNVVAMTGDGVNDAPALRAADIGVAMGVTGTDVTKEAADMILADDNFATIVAAVREGRGIFANIRTFLRFLLSSNTGEVLTMFLGVAGAHLIGLDSASDASAVPLLATQILWINLLTDTAPALALGVDPPPDDVMAHPPRRMTDRVVDAQMVRGIVVVGLVMAISALVALDLRLPGGLIEGSGSLDEGRTMAFTTLVLAQLYNCLNARSDTSSAFHRLFTNRLLWLAIGSSVVLQVAVVHLPLLNDAFSTTPLSLADWAICAALASGVLWAAELLKLVSRPREVRSRSLGQQFQG
ncbi:MAG: cation-translocating P-type ATPase [Chloroflexi bacterium]|nr:cation-translocating P-type ATPase [Chloroflexota bacterium]